MRNGLSYSEAGKMGYEKSKNAIAEKRQKNKENYENCPSFCDFCGRKIPYKKRKNKFCSSSCSASKNNIGIRRHGKPVGRCINCNKQLSRNPRKYCNNKCQSDYRLRRKIEDFEKFGKLETKDDNSIRQFLKIYLSKRDGLRCGICFTEKWNGIQVPLSVDHIDGNPLNHTMSNLRLVCGNCGGQLPTFAGRNRGNGRQSRREIYKRLGYC